MTVPERDKAVIAELLELYEHLQLQWVAMAGRVVGYETKPGTIFFAADLNEAWKWLLAHYTPPPGEG